MPVDVGGGRSGVGRRSVQGCTEEQLQLAVLSDAVTKQLPCTSDVVGTVLAMAWIANEWDSWCANISVGAGAAGRLTLHRRDQRFQRSHCLVAACSLFATAKSLMHD